LAPPRYRLVRRVAADAYGTTFEAIDSLQKKRVAFRSLPVSARADRTALGHALQAARELRSLVHPHLASILDAGTVGESCFLVADQVRGSTCQEVFDALAPLDWAEATRMIADACLGLAAFHNAGASHRAITLNSLMRTEGGEIVLTDLGLAPILEALGWPAPGLAVGMMGRPRTADCGPEADVASLGMVYHALLTGHFDFEAPLEQPVPEPCLMIVRRALTLAAEQRYPSATAMADHLERLVPPAHTKANHPETHWTDVRPASAVATPPAQGAEDTVSQPPAPNLADLTHLGPYRIVQLLGEGGMGLVFLAEEPSLSRLVALKVMKPDVQTPLARKRFLHEAKAAASIQHEHVVTIYQVGEDRGIPFLAMQFLQGESLEDRLKASRRLPLPDALRIAREAAEGLAAAHEKGLVHRDIKPANLWLERKAGGRERVKVLDFGLARSFQQPTTHLTQTGAIVGTPGYMAPEQARGNQPVDHRGDLFSLGCVLYRMVTGQEPFRREDTMATLLALALDEPTPPAQFNPEVSPALTRLLSALMSKAPGARPPSALAVIDSLAAMEVELSGTAVSLPARSTPAPPMISTEPVPWADESAPGPASAWPDIEQQPASLSVVDTPPQVLDKTDRLLARLAARGADREGGICPGCGGTIAQGWCVTCGYMASEAKAAPPIADPESKVPPDLKWLWVLLGGVLVVVVVSALIGFSFAKDSMGRVWWAVGEAIAGSVAIIAATTWAFLLTLSERQDPKVYQYLDPIELWHLTLRLLPGTRHPVCLGSWGTTALICCGLFLGAFTDWDGMARKRAETHRARHVPVVYVPSPSREPEPVWAYPVQEVSPSAAEPELRFVARDDAPESGEHFTTTCSVIGYTLDKDGKYITGLILGTKDGDRYKYAGTVPPDSDVIPRDFRKNINQFKTDKSVVDGAPVTGLERWLQPDAIRCEVKYSEVGADGQLAAPRIKEFQK
jgi:serine/threonine protein kinase